MNQLPNLIETLEFVTEAHTNRLIKPSKSVVPYHWHLLRVMIRLGEKASYEEKLVALLHDVLEDTNVTKEELQQRGYSDKVISDVVYCSYTEFPKLSKQKWMRLLHEEAPTSVIRLKYADICDNLGFERMIGLYEILKNQLLENNKQENNSSKKFFRQTKNFPILARIFTEILNNHPYSTEPKVYPPYYDSLNYLLNSEKNNREHEIKNIINLEFSDRLLVKKVLDYLPIDEKQNYMSLQKLNTWTIKGYMTLMEDNSKNNYIALTVDNDYVIEFQNYIQKNKGNQYIENQILRDKGMFHVTVINAAEYSNLKKNYPEKIETINEQIGNTIELFFHGIGHAEGSVKKNNEINTTFFAVLESVNLNIFREKLKLKKHDFHITIGFDKKDVHGVKKDRSTVITTPEEVHVFTYSDNLNSKNLTSSPP